MKRQVALCIGNQDYTNFSKLNYAVNDCQSMAEKLNVLGFDVLSYENLHREKMFSVAENFEKLFPEYEIALFYYAGHGFEVDGKNLLVPVNVPSADIKELKYYQAYTLDDIIERFQRHINLETKIIILDACRKDSLTRGIGEQKFAPVFAPEGTIIAFSTSPGQSAIEKDGHGAYTKALLSCIDTPRIPIENMFKHVREILASDTGGRQISWEHTSLIGNYFFNEDRIDAFSFYADNAFCDENYYFNAAHPLYNIIQALKSNDWYIQNPVFQQINATDYSDISPSDLFVLGRNIYQAAYGGAWKAEAFIKEFSSNQHLLTEVKQHILNGMAYEIYFDKHGNIREHFKSKHYLEILALVNIEVFQKCKNFIVSVLSENTEKVVFIPDMETKMHLYITSNEVFTESNGEVIHQSRAISYQGRNIMFKTKSHQEDYFYEKYYRIEAVKREIAKILVAPPDMIVVMIDIEAKGNDYFALPENMTFLFHEPKYDEYY